MQKDKKELFAYIIMAIFVVFAFISIISLPLLWFCVGIVLDNANEMPNNDLSENLILGIFWIIIFFGIPIISTVIQFFLNKELFVLQLVFLSFPMTVMIINIINI